jgi:single-stranded-DNA-specific exonuclease
MFEPFGRDNEKPNFMLLNAKVEGVVALSQGKHTRLRVNCNGGCVSLLWFSQITDEVPFKEGDAVDVVFNCEIGEYNGAEQLTLKLKDIRPSAINEESLISSLTVYNDIVTKKSNDKSHSPTREEIGVIYTFLRKNGGYKYSSICLYNILKEKYSYAKMMLSLEIMKELNLIDGDFHSQLMNIKIIPQTEKLDLNTSQLFCRIH